MSGRMSRIPMLIGMLSNKYSIIHLLSISYVLIQWQWGVALGWRVVAPLARRDWCANGARLISLGQRPRNTATTLFPSPERAKPGNTHAQARDLEQTIAGNVAEILEA